MKTQAEYDAKRAELEKRIADYGNALERAKEIHDEACRELAALGPRPEGRKVEWTEESGHVWTWTCDGGRIKTSVKAPTADYNSYLGERRIPAVVPNDVALRVLLLAYDEGPVGYANVYPKWISDVRATPEDARRLAHHDAIEIAVPLYRAPVGERVGACVNPYTAFIEALKADREMQWAYHCNIAMAGYDKGVPHRQANEAASLFLERLLGDYTPLHNILAVPVGEP